jgi:hypothetical protein
MCEKLNYILKIFILDCFRLRLRNDMYGVLTSLRHCKPQSGEAIQKK